MANTIPTLDFQLLQSNRKQFVAQLRQALSTTGFLLLSNALSLKLVDEIFRQSRAFFDLRIEDKKAIAMIHSPQFRGYSALGEEITAHRIDAREQIDFGPETETTPDAEITPETTFLHLYGPNLFPDDRLLPHFKQTMLDWRSACDDIATQIVAAIGEAVEDPAGTGKGRIEGAFEGGVPYARSKIVSYPGTYEDAPLGVGAHRDGGGLTLLLQDAVGGLQVQRWDGTWEDVPANPHLVVVNIGQVLENLTAGSLRATTHRVLIPRRPRISVPYFYSPPLLSALKPLTFDELHPDLQEQIRERDEEVSEVPRGDLHFPRFGEGAWKGIIRSHVAVYDKWYGSSNVQDRA